MSALLQGNNPLAAFLPTTDDRSCIPSFQWGKAPPRQIQSPWADGQLWSRSGGLGGQFSNYGMVGDDLGQTTAKWELFGDFVSWGAYSVDDSGGAFQNSLIGFTYDQFANPLGNCIVQGFLTANDQIVNQVTSDPSGYYKLPVPYSTSTALYIVCYKAGPPDVAGTSADTLTPSNVG